MQSHVQFTPTLRLRYSSTSFNDFSLLLIRKRNEIFNRTNVNFVNTSNGTIYVEKSIDTHQSFFAVLLGNYCLEIRRIN